MNRKSFFKGFGTGVLFSSLILGISFTIRTSDSYVSSRAKELGMVYENTEDSELNLADRSTSEEKATVTATPSAKKKKEAASAKPKETAAPTPAVTPAVTPDAKKQSSKKEEAEKTKKELQKEKEKMEREIRAEKKKLTISAGDWSSDVSKRLQDLGIVKSATDFDKYLNDHGYASAISAGTYDVSIDDTYEQLAKKITGR